MVAITGSYGKTTTKLYVGHLLAGTFRTVVSPASFNNRMGLARAINENLVPGTQVFVAEMGTYGPGEIAELTGFEYDVSPSAAETPAPTAEELALLRGPVAKQMAPDYPEFARRVWGNTLAA